MPRKLWKPVYRHSDAVDLQPPKFLPGDPVISIDDGTAGKVEYARHDAMCCVVWDGSGQREWLHEDLLRWPADFQPVRRR
jgi:hypothetical protein